MSPGHWPLLVASRQKLGEGKRLLHLARLAFSGQNNVDLDCMAGHFARLFSFEGSLLTEGRHAMWMRGWPIFWQGGWSRPLQSLVCLDFFAGMLLRAQIHT